MLGKKTINENSLVVKKKQKTGVMGSPFCQLHSLCLDSPPCAFDLQTKTTHYEPRLLT